MAKTTTLNQDRAIRDEITERLGDMTWLFELIEKIADPEDIFDELALERWAIDNGFVKEEK